MSMLLCYVLDEEYVRRNVREAVEEHDGSMRSLRWDGACLRKVWKSYKTHWDSSVADS